MLRDRLAKLAAPQCECPAFPSPLFTDLSVTVSRARGRVDEMAAQAETGKSRAWGKNSEPEQTRRKAGPGEAGAAVSAGRALSLSRWHCVCPDSP